MRNNTRGLLFHLFTLVIVFIMARVIDFSVSLRNMIYGNAILCGLVSLVPLLLYYHFGKGMSKQSSKRLDFFAGNMIVLLGVLFFLLAFAGMGTGVFQTPVAASYWKFPVEFFLMPQVYVLRINHLPYNALSLFLASLVPTILYGISIKKGRAKMLRRQRAMKHRREMEMRRMNRR